MVEEGSTRPRDQARRPVAGTADEAVTLVLPAPRGEPRTGPGTQDGTGPGTSTGGGTGTGPGTAPGLGPATGSPATGSLATGSPATVPPLHVAPCRSVDEAAEVFGTRGDAAHCWCAFDRLPDAQFDTLTPDEGRALLAVELAAPGPVPGLIATLGGQRIGWCSVAPRWRFPRLATRRTTSSPQTAGDDPDVWSVTCFVVRPGFRRRGTAAALLDAAVAYARSSGAGWLEGYPSDTTGRKPAAADLYRGTLSLFTAAGFEVVAQPWPGRAIVRLEL